MEIEAPEASEIYLHLPAICPGCHKLNWSSCKEKEPTFSKHLNIIKYFKGKNL